MDLRRVEPREIGVGERRAGRRSSRAARRAGRRGRRRAAAPARGSRRRRARYAARSHLRCHSRPASGPCEALGREVVGRDRDHDARRWRAARSGASWTCRSCTASPARSAWAPRRRPGTCRRRRRRAASPPTPRVLGEPVVGGRQAAGGAAARAVLDPVDERLRVLHPEADGEGLRLDGPAARGEALEELARAVPRGEHEPVAGRGCARRRARGPRTRPPATSRSVGARAPQERAAAPLELLAHGRDGARAARRSRRAACPRTRMRVGVAEAGEELDHLAHGGVVDAGAELPVGVGAGAALAEVHVRLGVERPVAHRARPRRAAAGPRACPRSTTIERTPRSRSPQAQKRPGRTRRRG